MWLMLQQDKPDDFVIATNKTWTVRELVERAFKEINIEIEYVSTTLGCCCLECVGETYYQCISKHR